MPNLIRNAFSGEQQRPAAVLLVGLCFALLTGYIEAAVHMFRYHVLHRMVWTTTEILWVAPLAYVGLFAPVVLLLYVVARFMKGNLPLPLVVGLLAYPMAWVASVMVIGTRIHWLAHMVLALGAAVQLARWSKSQREGFGRFVRATTPILSAATLVLALAIPGSRILLEKRAVSNLAAARTGAPNVVLIIWDTVRRTNLSVYGYGRETTPNLERRAARAVVFNQAQSTAPWTLSSHASMFTGYLTQQLSPDWDAGLDGTYPTVAEALRSQGYNTAGFVANLLATQHDSGLNRGFIRYEDYEIAGSSFFLSTLIGQRIDRPKPFNRGPIRYYPMKEAPDLTDDFLRWVPETGDRPFFAFLNYIDAHHDFPAPPDLVRKFGSKGRMNKYDAAIGSLDRQLDRLMTELERRGVLENTIVILASDHGEQFGEKKLYQHGNSLYQPALVVPLMVWLPRGQHGGLRVQAPVSLRDLASTILELTGVKDDRFPGRSLARHWMPGAVTAPDTLIAGVQKRMGAPNGDPNSKGDMNSTFTAQHSYILNGDGEEELFDVIADPGENRNLAKDPANAEHLRRFRDVLRARVPKEWLSSLPDQSSQRAVAAGSVGPRR